MKVLITGALGHIGSRLIRDLAVGFPDADLILADDLSTQRYGSLFNLPPVGRYRFHELDVLQADLARLFTGVQVVVHLAAITDAASSFANKDKVEEVNLAGTERVARACLETGSALIFVSTTSVYGVQDGVVDEDCPPDALKPQSPYAESKLQAERLLQRMGPGGLRHLIFRFGTIFGVSPGMRFHTAVNKFVWQACMGMPVTVWRTALHQKRPYLDLGDAVRAMDFAIRRNEFDNSLYNVVTTNATVGEIIDIIRAEVGDLRVELVDSRIMNQLSYEVSPRKIERIGFAFSGNLREGIRETVQLLRQCRSIPGGA